MSGKINATRSNFKKEALTHLDSLLRAALYMTADRSTAQNLIQETYLRAYCLWGNLKGAMSFRTRLFRAMTGLLQDHNHSQSQIDEIEILADVEEVISAQENGQPALEPDIVDEMCNRVDEDMVKKAIGSLPFDLRIVVVLANTEGFSYQEISEITENNIGIVKERISRGRHLLQKIILKSVLSKKIEERSTA